MNLRPLLIGASLIANVALAIAVSDRTVHWTAVFASAASNAPAATATASTAAAVPTPPPLDPKVWKGLLGTDLAATLAHLRAEGFPPSMQRAILAALIAEQFADRHKALASMINAEPWWRGNLYGSNSGAKILAARQQLQRDEKEALDNLLGADSGLTAYARAQQIKQYGNLPPEKLSELNRINSDYNELMSEVRNAAQGILLPEDRDKLAYLEKEKRADITAALTPDELFEYDLHNSSTAGSLRYQLAAFNPTEDEFRAIFKVRQAFDAQYANGNFDMMTMDQRRAYGEAQAELTKQIQPLLSADRYAEYQQKTDPAYIQANALVTRLNLPATATSDIVAVQKDITKRASAIRQDNTLSPPDRAVQLKALGDEAVLRLTPTLGDAGIAAYRQSGGYWINTLQRASSGPLPTRAPAPKQ